jgi:flagellar biosynthesis protein FlhB
LVLGGWVFSTEALAPKFSRLNPIEGFGRVFSMNGVMELAKAVAKFAIVGLVAVIVLRKHLNEMMGLGSEPVDKGVIHAASMCGSALLAMGGALGFIALIDVPYQLWSHAKKLRMTRQEIREEYKESDGSPESKRRIRERQQEIARGRMMSEVPKADVVVTNPTHFAVALRYDDKKMRAPIVVAKGADLIAARIRAVAGEHAVPIFEAPPLARLLYRNVDIGAEIPNTVYVAVAQVLTYIYQLKTARQQGMQTPEPPVVEVPEELVPKPEDLN